MNIKGILEQHNNPVVAFSGGKDSTVVLDLVRKIDPGVVGVFCDTGIEYPSTYRYVERVHDIVTIKRDVGVVMSANLKRAKDDVAFWEGMLENGRDIEGIGDRVKREKAVALDKLVYLWIRGNRGDYGIEDNGSWLNGHKDLVSIIFGGKPVGVDEVIKKIKEVNE